MPYRMNYPATVAEVLNPPVRFKMATLRAVGRFARSKPWRGTIEERRAKFNRLGLELSVVYGIAEPDLRLVMIGAGVTSNGFYSPLAHCIGLIGKMSVLTYLHEFRHALGGDERQACRWSINLFRRCFPRSFARCRTVGHMLVLA
jgi:hypothetical protein